MEIYSPRGRLVETRKPDRALGSFYAFRVPTAEDAETGAWQARVLVGGLTFTKTVRIETVVPNRLKIDFRTGRDVLNASDVPLEANIASQWLHGAPASNLKFDVSVRLASRRTAFKDFPDFEFQDPTREFKGGEVAVGQGTLDKDGRGRVKLDFAPARPSPGMLDATFVTRVFEESGDFSLDSFTQPYHPYDCYVGVRVPAGDTSFGMLVTDKEHTVDIVTVDPYGRGLSRRNLKVSFYKIDWRWWWEREGESLAEFISRPWTRPLASAEVSTEQGRGSWRFRVAYPDWGRFLVRVEDPEGGHAAGKIVYVDWPGWAGRSRATGQEAATRLSFTSDKAAYQVGEKAVIYIPESVQGRALVSVENGSSVLQKMWVSTRQGENRFEIRVTDKMTPNAYVHVSLLQPHRGKVSDAPIRMYGVIPIMVEDQATALEPALKAPDEIRPGERFTVQVGEKKGRAMTYTVAVVDEGLLGLTRFKTPDLRQEFYKREALGVTTWDLFDRIVEAYGAELTRILALGGDEAAAARDAARKPRRFPPVVMFDGPFEVRAGATASHEFLMPQYFGAVRVMVVAGREGAFGSAEKSVLVRKDLMALPTLPRVVRPGEDIAMPITIFVTNPAMKQVEASVETNELFQVVGETSKTVPFSEPGDRVVTFSLRTAQAVGQGRVRFRVRSGAETVEDTVWIPVLGSNPMITRSDSFEVKPGQTLKRLVTPFGIESTNTVAIEASTLPPLNLEKRLDFLIQYPYGCLEQTLSTAFPQLYLKSLVRLDERQSKEVENHIKAAVDRLGRFQMFNGAFTYWPGGRQEHEWTSVYAGWFLLEASRLGYSVPEHMLAAWKVNQKMLANSWTTGGRAQEQTQAFRLFALASARDPDLGAMNRLRERKGLDPAAALQLAAAFNALGMREAATELAGRTELKTEPYRDLSVTFGSQVRDKALMARSLVLLDMKDRAKPLVEEMVRTVASDYWLSTNETAFALMAIAAYYGTAGIKPFTYSFAWDGETPATVESGSPVDRKVFADFPVSGRTLSLTNKADTPLSVTIYTKGVPPAGEEAEAASEVELKVVFRDMAMNPIDITSIRQGTDLVADVRVRNIGPRELKNVVLAQLVAAGFQIKNPMFAAGLERPAGCDYQDVRDDRVLTFFSLAPGEERTFLIVLNASYLGRFYQPGAAAEAMYDASVHANSKGTWVNIVQ